MSFTSHPLSQRIGDWIAARQRGPEYGDVLLDRKRVYILPTRAGILFGAALLSLLVGSINYALQMGFALTFLAASMALVSMYHTHRNLTRVMLRAHHADNAYAGDHLSFEIVLVNPTSAPRQALGLMLMPPRRRRKRTLFSREDDGPVIFVDLPATGSRHLSLALATRRRGARACPRVRIDTRFPLGLWQAWAYYTPPLRGIVYPAPEENAPPLPLALDGVVSNGVAASASGDDFAGVRPYRDGDPQKIIAWKLAARSDQLAVKLFEATAGADLLLDYDALPAKLPSEQRLARLARWVLEADAAHQRYGLRLPGSVIELNRGIEHRERCLVALALAPV